MYKPALEYESLQEDYKNYLTNLQFQSYSKLYEIVFYETIIVGTVH